MSRSPSFRFYASDFLGSPTVQLMDAAEVGAYMLLLCMAWESERHGYLPDDDDKLRRWARLPRDQWPQSRELILSKFPVTEPGWRSNARMVFEAAKQHEYSKSRSANGRKGGRPKKHLLSDSGDKNEGKAPHGKPINHMVSPAKHVRTNEKHVASKRKPAVAVAVTEGKDTRKSVCEPFFSGWNESCGKLPKLLKFSNSRADKLRIRIGEGLNLEQWTKVIGICNATAFLRGEGAKGWKASFDWLVENDTNMAQVLEGKYGKTDARSPGARGPLKLVEPDMYRGAEYQPKKAVNQ